jgi:hypothetical protein
MGKKGQGRAAAFNTQAFLVEMRRDFTEQLGEFRRESQASHTATDTKIDALAAEVNKHETRITVVEGTHKTARWFVGILTVAIVGTAISYLAGLLK